MQTSDGSNRFASSVFLHIFHLPQSIYLRNFGWGSSNDDFESGSATLEGEDAFEVMTQHLTVLIDALALNGCEFAESANHRFWRFERHGVMLSATVVRQTPMIVCLGLTAQLLTTKLLYDARGRMLK